MKRIVCQLIVVVVVGIWHPLRAAAPPTDELNPQLTTSPEPVVELEAGWENPPPMSRTRCWWWWLNGNVTREAITRDLEQMKAKGLGGANIIDAGGAEQRGHRQVPHGPDFASDAWRDLFLHALAEADRLGLELGFNVQSGWNLGGPTVQPEHAAKKLTWAETMAVGGQRLRLELPQPAVTGDYYRDVASVAATLLGFGPTSVAPILVSYFISVHHFFTDGVIWKLRMPEVQEDLFSHARPIAATVPVPPLWWEKRFWRRG